MSKQGTMSAAVYYPHTAPVGANVMRTALLLWDEIEFIVPWQGFRPQHERSDIQAAIDMIGRFHVPSDAQKRDAHARVEEFATGALPKAFFYQEKTSGEEGYMFAGKLMPETWLMLSELGLRGSEDGEQYRLEDAMGLTLMSIVADCCAGETKARVTDRTLAYQKLNGILLDTDDLTQADTERVALVPIVLSLVDATSLPLSSLIEMRRREASRGGRHLPRLRARLRDRLERQASQIAGLERAADAAELKRQLEIELEDDLGALRHELQMAKGEALLSRDVVVTAAVGALAAGGRIADVWGGTAAAVTGGLSLAAGLMGARLKYAKERRTILERHPMAYMLEIADALPAPLGKC